jgi:hypothetical protein
MFLYYFSRINWTTTSRRTRDEVPKGNIHVMYVVRCFEIYSHSKPISGMFIRLVVVNAPGRRPSEQKGKELMNQVCINENISITNFVFIQIFFLLYSILIVVNFADLMCILSMLITRNLGFKTLPGERLWNPNVYICKNIFMLLSCCFTDVCVLKTW